MPLVLGLDLGTTTITALALDAGGGVAASQTVANTGEITPAADRARGRSEWDACAIAGAACECLQRLAGQLGGRAAEVAGLGLTGQQHGVVVAGADLAPRTPFINWQDRRGEEPAAGSAATWTQRARERLGDASRRTGCQLATGYLATTLFWLRESGALPREGTACFIGDYFAALLTGQRPATDATFAASSGVFDVAAGEWGRDAIAALGLPFDLFPEVRPSGELFGPLTPEMAGRTGLPAGLPVFVGVGDNQAKAGQKVSGTDTRLLLSIPDTWHS